MTTDITTALHVYFPEYDNEALLTRVADALIPLGFQTAFWRNDCAPCFIRQHATGHYLRVYVDYASGRLREDGCEGGPCLHTYDDRSEEDHDLGNPSFHSVEVLLAYVRRRIA